MKAKALKAILKCCEKPGGLGAVREIVIKDGKLYASDSIVAVRIRSDEIAGIGEGVWHLDFDAIKKAKSSDELSLKEIASPYEGRYPSFDEAISFIATGQDKEPEFFFDPRLLKKVADVYDACFCDMKVRFGKNALYVQSVWNNTTLNIDAVVMGKRR